VHTRNISHILLIGLFAALLAAWGLPSPVQAQAGSAMDLVNAVNAYRAQNGRAPYGVDGTLMSQAQSHSEYQASIEECTHIRADGSGPGAHGISAENIACGNDMSVETAIYSQWTDSVHTATMLGPEEGLVGAGAVNVGGRVYYTLAVVRVKGEFVYFPPASPANAAGGDAAGADAGAAAADQPPAQTGQQIGPVATTTPRDDGSIAHVIQYGETLVDIASAYGLTLPELISMNRLDPNNPVYYENDVLVIRPAFTETPFITTTFTPRPPTRTPMPSRTPRPTRTITPIRSPEPTRTDTPQPLIALPSIDDLGSARNAVAYAFIAISAVGLLVLLFTAFLPGKSRD
jgi:LysM repeat protein